ARLVGAVGREVAAPLSAAEGYELWRNASVAVARDLFEVHLAGETRDRGATGIHGTHRHAHRRAGVLILLVDRREHEALEHQGLYRRRRAVRDRPVGLIMSEHGERAAGIERHREGAGAIRQLRWIRQRGAGV